MNIQINSAQSIFGSSNSQSLTSATQALSDAFRNELSSVLQSTLGKFGINASGITISVGPTSSAGQERQNIVTGSVAAALAPAAAPTPATTPASGSIAAALAPAVAPTPATTPAPGSIAAALAPAVAPTPATTPAPGSIAAALAPAVVPTPATPVSITSPAPAPLTFDQAYWASQPAAVQQLQNISDPNQRAQLATQLTEQGYKVDVPIMVWGWDPQKVTDLRQSFGYTWVPSAGQTPVQEAPGLNVYGLQPYDPTNAPANSIQVG